MTRRFELVALVVMVACDCDEETLATVETVSAEVDRDHAASVGEWERARPDDTLRFGEAIRTGDASTAMLSVRGGGRLEVRPATLVRFGRGEGAGAPVALELEMGEVVLEGGAEGWSADSFLGRLTLESGARVRVGRDGVEVLLGSLDLRTSSGSALALDEGDRAELGERGVTIVDADAAEAESTDGTDGEAAAGETLGGDEPDAEDIEAAALDSRVRRTPLGDVPERWAFEVGAGRPATIHAPTTPARLAMRVDGDCEGGAVTVGRGRSARRYPVRSHRAPMSLSRGRHPYTVHCPGRDDVRGRLRVLRDAGTAPLPRTPPSSLVELDGRRYTVLYQNRSPEIEVRWPRAGANAVLLVDGQPQGSGPGRWTLSSGRLREGLHTLSAREGARRAPETRVLLRFDNVAPKVALREPDNRAFASGDRVEVEGVLLPGWHVYVGGRPVQATHSGRFRTEHDVRPDHDGFALELRHARHGVHYYVREAR